MPAGYAHEYCARKALTWLSPGDREIIEWNLAAYLLGAQGPDVLFFHGILPPWRSHEPNRAGVALHCQSGSIMAPELVLRARGAQPAAAAWTLGYLCHWMADAAAHPYVLAVAAEKGTSKAHGIIEQGADTQLYQLDNEGIPEQMSFLRELSADDAHSIAVLFASAAGKALPRRQFSARQIETAIADTRRFHGFLYTPDGKRYRQFRRLERMIGKPCLLTAHIPPSAPTGDPLNLEHRPWRTAAAPETVQTESLIERLDEAAKATARAIDATLRCWDGQLELDEVMSGLGERRMADGEV